MFKYRKENASGQWDRVMEGVGDTASRTGRENLSAELVLELGPEERQGLGQEEIQSRALQAESRSRGCPCAALGVIFPNYIPNSKFSLWFL